MSETIPEYGGCLWPLDPACLTDEWNHYEPDQQARAAALASEALRRLTGYRVGGCPITVRPCQQNGCWGAFVPFIGWSALSPGVNINGQWVNGCACGGGGCATPCEVALPRPIGRVDQVKVDGVVLDEDDYEVHNRQFLVWTGTDPCPFPATQNLALPDTAADTFSVTYLNSFPVDGIGAHAAGLLAVEFGKACYGGKCQLPKSVREVVRTGVTYTIQPGLFPDGFTGIKEVDSYIETWNPHNLSHKPTVWSPDMPTYRRVT